jgi:hypothetical protein
MRILQKKRSLNTSQVCFHRRDSIHSMINRRESLYSDKVQRSPSVQRSKISPLTIENQKDQSSWTEMLTTYSHIHHWIQMFLMTKTLNQRPKLPRIKLVQSIILKAVTQNQLKNVETLHLTSQLPLRATLHLSHTPTKNFSFTKILMSQNQCQATGAMIVTTATTIQRTLKTSPSVDLVMINSNHLSQSTKLVQTWSKVLLSQRTDLMSLKKMMMVAKSQEIQEDLEIRMMASQPTLRKSIQTKVATGDQKDQKTLQSNLRTLSTRINLTLCSHLTTQEAAISTTLTNLFRSISTANQMMMRKIQIIQVDVTSQRTQDLRKISAKAAKKDQKDLVETHLSKVTDQTDHAVEMIPMTPIHWTPMPQRTKLPRILKMSL